MVKSISNQDAIERFIRKVDAARRALSQQDDSQPRRRARTSPSDHYSIAQSSRKSEDLTAWLGIRRNDPAFRVSATCHDNSLLIGCRIFSRNSRTISSLILAA